MRYVEKSLYNDEKVDTCMWNFKSHFLILMNSFLVFLLIMVIYVHFFIDLELGDKVGSGIFYLKGYYEIYEKYGGEMRHGYTEETGLGVYVLPFIASILVTFSYIIIERHHKSRKEKVSE